MAIPDVLFPRRPPMMVFATERGTQLRFVKPGQIAANGTIIHRFLKEEMWRSLPVWESRYGPGGDRYVLPHLRARNPADDRVLQSVDSRAVYQSEQALGPIDESYSHVVAHHALGSDHTIHAELYAPQRSQDWREGKEARGQGSRRERDGAGGDGCCRGR